MARENQGLQIALITFVILTLLLAVFTYLFFRQYDEQYRKAQAALEEAAKANDAARSAQTDLNTLKTILGFSTTDPMDKITQTAKQELETYGADLDPSQQNYRTVLDHLFKTLQAKSATLVATEQKLRDAEAKIAQLEASKAPLIAQEKNRADQAEATLTQERQKFTADLQASFQARDDLQKRVTEAQQQAQDALAQLDAAKKDFDRRIRTVSALLAVRTKELEATKNPRLETPDGRIQWVNQQLGTVWINLGEADGLSVGTTFAVFPGNTLNIADAERKGGIEVTAIRGPHLAEARIIDDKVSDPIMPGDVISTLIWSPGDRRRFAITNFVDIDDDGRSDQELLISIIRQSNGIVDAWLDDEGNLHGQLTADTDYIVVGNEPPEGTNVAVIQARSDMLKRADEMAVQRISVRELLRRIGYKRETHVVRFGPGANPADFRAKPKEDEVIRQSTGAVSEIFQPRQPPRAKAGTAF
ncbi:hypothetical protein THTE_4150 [Thermogutta terrifontis]|jgi:type II secretory pathway pseudopilin PulG|uniref:Uncharacterized protein n=1 Tax=Thermogutta terrifontis TaxID=1331910 RepID=A0A286RLC6_9BACT|nr:DUF4199 domain-containing protein [Thermogutta terrifontis]ASV76751.1 hypothetical protein THTE_4150 [Thermogutta terrifontis]